MKPVSAGSKAAVHSHRPASAGANATAKLQANITRLKDNAHAVAGLDKALAKLQRNADRFKTTQGQPTATKTDLGVG